MKKIVSESLFIDPVRWPVERTAVLKEVHLEDGQIQYRVEVFDPHRPPFIIKWFNDPSPASDFIERLRVGQ